MNQAGYAFLGLTALVAMLVGVLTFAAMRFLAAARNAQKQSREHGSETALLSAALSEAVAKLKAQERAMSARAAASEQLSSLIVESLTAGLLLVSNTGVVEILNPAGRRMLGLDELLDGRDYHDVLARFPALAAVIGRGLLHGLSTRDARVDGSPSTANVPSLSRQTVTVDVGGRTIHLGASVSPLGGDGALRGVICLFSDLTTVMELEEQLRLKETLARLGELTAGIAHEFRNGLATIHGYSHLLDPQALPAPYGPYVVGIRQETEALGQVVTNFLNFARPEQVVLAPVDLEAVVTRVTEELRHELPASATLMVVGSFATVQGDEVLLRQAFNNLVRNAVEACESAGLAPRVTITGTVDAAVRQCRVQVEDNGPGIPQSARPKIFQPFFTTRSRGTGLGLAIVQKVMVMHNGRVSVGDAPAGGASIQLTFPLG